MPATFTWQPLKVGGGGFTRDMDIAPDGTMVCKVDVYGAYVWNPSAPSTGNAGGTGNWQPLCKPGPIPAGDPAYSWANIFTNNTFNFFGAQGAYAIRIAPSNSNVIYMLWLGMMYKSTNKGVTFTNLSDTAGGTFPRQTASVAGSNAGNTFLNGPGPTMAIDPQNPNVCWIGMASGGNAGRILFTQDGGSTWTTLSTALLPQPVSSGSNGYGSYGFAFDPLSAVTGGKTQGIYAFVSGSGVYYSSNAGAAWTLLSGGSFSGTMPTAPLNMVVDKFGVLWLTNDVGAGTNLWNFTVQSGTAFVANTWTNASTPAGMYVWAAMPDPASSTSAAQRVVICDFAGALSQTTNGGSTWAPKLAFLTANQTLTATDIPWLATNETNFSLDGMPKFDPSRSNYLYWPQGIGVWYSNLPTVGGGGTWPTVNWVSQTSGIESLETTQIISPPGGNVGLLQWDRNWFSVNPRVGLFPTNYGTSPTLNPIVAGQGGDWAGSNSNFIAVQSGSANTAYSTNGGVPVTGFSSFAVAPGAPGNPNGACGIAVNSSNSIMTVCNGLSATTNGGASWSIVTPAASTGWSNGGQQTNIQLAADKVTANYYVAYAGGKIYYTSNTGGSWTTVTPGFNFGASPSAGASIQLKAIPNNAGHYFITGGGSFLTPPDTTSIFYRSTNGGQTWADVSQGAFTVRDVWVWGYGAASSSYPTIFIYGSVNGTLGVWKSSDNCVSWVQIGDAQYGGQSFDVPNCMNGDMNRAGVVYIGFFGSGYIQYN